MTLPKAEIHRLLWQYCGGDGTVILPADFGYVWTTSKLQDTWHDGGQALRNLLRAMGMAPREEVKK